MFGHAGAARARRPPELRNAREYIEMRVATSNFAGVFVPPVPDGRDGAKRADGRPGGRAETSRAHAQCGRRKHDEPTLRRAPARRSSFDERARAPSPALEDHPPSGPMKPPAMRRA
ncbi:hypothetical protein DB32_004465 [Sandaracinus amylolyticus]|uniref:Uncharacterized protein n=1 Tax=Sandaracinus amylolyticus TaxID=927083 RepID=A0A0F6YKI2_9BACT|nr:hypothetical protein DB32_004465 [Sandaracinus amylolyticus]